MTERLCLSQKHAAVSHETLFDFVKMVTFGILVNKNEFIRVLKHISVERLSDKDPDFSPAHCENTEHHTALAFRSYVKIFCYENSVRAAFHSCKTSFRRERSYKILFHL